MEDTVYQPPNDTHINNSSPIVGWGLRHVRCWCPGIVRVPIQSYYSPCSGPGLRDDMKIYNVCGKWPIKLPAEWIQIWRQDGGCTRARRTIITAVGRTWELVEVDENKVSRGSVWKREARSFPSSVIPFSSKVSGSFHSLWKWRKGFLSEKWKAFALRRTVLCIWRNIVVQTRVDRFDASSLRRSSWKGCEIEKFLCLLAAILS